MDEGEADVAQPGMAMQPLPVDIHGEGDDGDDDVALQGEWNEGLCGCCADIGSCLLGLCCPALVSMEVAAELEAHSIFHCIATCSLFSCGMFPIFTVSGCLLRRRFRHMKYIQGGDIGDFVAGGLCHWCNLCQMSRELQVRPLPIFAPFVHQKTTLIRASAHLAGCQGRRASHGALTRGVKNAARGGPI